MQLSMMIQYTKGMELLRNRKETAAHPERLKPTAARIDPRGMSRSRESRAPLTAHVGSRSRVDVPPVRLQGEGEGEGEREGEGEGEGLKVEMVHKVVRHGDDILRSG